MWVVVRTPDSTIVVSSWPQGASLMALDASRMAKNNSPTKKRKYLRTLMVTVSFRTGRPQAVEVMFLTAGVDDQWQVTCVNSRYILTERLYYGTVKLHTGRHKILEPSI